MVGVGTVQYRVPCPTLYLLGLRFPSYYRTFLSGRFPKEPVEGVVEVWVSHLVYNSTTTPVSSSSGRPDGPEFGPTLCLVPDRGGTMGRVLKVTRGRKVVGGPGSPDRYPVPPVRPGGYFRPLSSCGSVTPSFRLSDTLGPSPYISYQSGCSSLSDTQMGGRRPHRPHRGLSRSRDRRGPVSLRLGTLPGFGCPEDLSGPVPVTSGSGVACRSRKLPRSLEEPPEVSGPTSACVSDCKLRRSEHNPYPVSMVFYEVPLPTLAPDLSSLTKYEIYGRNGW